MVWCVVQRSVSVKGVRWGLPQFNLWQGNLKRLLSCHLLLLSAKLVFIQAFSFLSSLSLDTPLANEPGGWMNEWMNRIIMSLEFLSAPLPECCQGWAHDLSEPCTRVIPARICLWATYVVSFELGSRNLRVFCFSLCSCNLIWFDSTCSFCSLDWC